MGQARKFLPPSGKKLQQARERGDVAKSKELSFGLELAGLIVYMFWGLSNSYLFLEFFQKSLQGSRDFHTNNMLVYGREACNLMLGLLWPPVLILFFSTLGAEVLQVGVKVSFSALSWKWSRLNMFVGIRRMFGFEGVEGENGLFGQVLFDWCKPALLVALMFISSLYVLIPAVSEIFREGGVDARATLEVSFVLIRQALTSMLAVILLWGCGLLIYARHQRMKRLSMDVEEFRKELRESEGDPETKGMRKQLHRELLRASLVQGVRRAKVVVRNARSGFS